MFKRRTDSSMKTIPERAKHLKMGSEGEEVQGVALARQVQ